MLANDSTSADKKRAFFLVVHTDQAVAELMAECAPDVWCHDDLQPRTGGAAAHGDL
jgi:hypothetical protein